MPGWKKRTDFGERVRALADYRKVSLQQLADKVGCSRGFLYRVLRGEQEPSWSFACAVAEALDFWVTALQEGPIFMRCPHCGKLPTEDKGR